MHEGGELSFIACVCVWDCNCSFVNKTHFWILNFLSYWLYLNTCTIGQVHLLVFSTIIYYIKTNSRLSVCPSVYIFPRIYIIKLKSRPSVCLHFFPRHADNSVVSAWIDSGLDLCDSCVLWHEQVCFYKSVSALCWAHKSLKGTAVAPFCRT